MGFVLSVVCSFFGFSANCNSIEEKILRFHVLANSDSEYDQDMKILVKDQVFAYVTGILENSTSLEESETIVTENLGEIENIANQVLEENGAKYTASVELCTSYFNTREYDTFTLPAGNYSSLKIIIGQGDGQNWWCALYPSLCISAAVDFDDFSEDEEEIITSDGYEISFKLYEVYQNFKNRMS